MSEASELKIFECFCLKYLTLFDILFEIQGLFNNSSPRDYNYRDEGP